jgi:predicted RNase H-like nuclease
LRILGADLAGDDGRRPGTLVSLDPAGSVALARQPASLSELAAQAKELASGEPFLLGVNLALAVPPRSARTRPVDNLARRRLGVRLPPAGRASLLERHGGIPGEALLAALAAAGLPCLPFPDRDRRASGLAEIHPALVLKALLWERSAAARDAGRAEQEAVFRAVTVPAYQREGGRSRPGWAERAAALGLVLSVLGKTDGYDLRLVREALAASSTDADVDRAASLLDAVLLAGTARRYLESPEACLFLGDREEGYTILPADGFIRGLVGRERGPARAGLFPKASLRETLEPVADLLSPDLLDVPGRPQRLEASFHQPPLYEFDNLDEMLWWKHCRHLSGPALPTEGLQELTVILASGTEGATAATHPLRLVRSRHRTLSFRFDLPASWRAYVPTRDGKVYPFRVLRAMYETAPAE